MEVAEILEQVDSIEFISQYCDLEEKHGEFWGLSPFTNEKTPSFSVREEGVWYDFSSGQGGNLIDFITKYHNVSVPSAVKLLKSFANIQDDGQNSVTRLNASKIARKFKPSKQNPPPDAPVILPDDVMSNYSFDIEKLSVWHNEGISYDAMRFFDVKFDHSSNRIVFPIRDYNGNIISVCGRTCDPDYKAKKLRKYTYFQSVGTISTLYGFSDFHSDILSKKEIILFEGAKSVMIAYGWGYNNCAAILTSHLNPYQMEFLIKLAGWHGVRIVFALDSDIDIRKDKNIMKLVRYAKVEWVKNVDNVLEPKEAPVDKGLNVFEKLYRNRIKLNLSR